MYARMVTSHTQSAIKSCVHDAVTLSRKGGIELTHLLQGQPIRILKTRCTAEENLSLTANEICYTLAGTSVTGYTAHGFDSMTRCGSLGGPTASWRLSYKKGRTEQATDNVSPGQDLKA